MKYEISGFADEYAKSLPEQIEGFSALGIRYMELRFIDGVNVADLSLERAKEIKKELDAANIHVSAIGSPLGKISVTDDLSPHLEKAKRVFEIANLFECQLIRIFSFYIPKDHSREEYRQQVFERVGCLLDLADQYGVILCHENERGIYGESPEDVLDLLSHFNGRLRCVFDMGNFVLEGYKPLEVAFPLLRPYIAYFHIKDGTEDGVIVPAGMGDAKIQEILAEFSADNDIFVSLEPHLSGFVGLGNLTANQLKHNYHFDSPEQAFSFHAKAVKEVLRRIGK